MQIFNKMDKIVRFIGIAGCIVAGCALVFNFGLIVYDVISRYFFSNAVRGSNEYVSLAETVLIFFGLAYTQYKRGMVHVTFFMRMLPKRGPVISWAIVNLFGTVVSILLMYASFVHAAFITEMRSATLTLYIPYYPFYYLMGTGFALFAIQLLFDSIKNVLALFNKDLREQVVSEWPA